MSLLLANGHPEAAKYPLGMLADEALMVRHRMNNRMTTEALLLQQAVSSVLSKEAGELFSKTIDQLTAEE